MIRYISDEQWEKIIRDNQRQDDLKEWLEWLEKHVIISEYDYEVRQSCNNKIEELKKEIEK